MVFADRACRGGILEPKDRNAIKEVISFFLRSQFVTSTLSESGRVFQVEQVSVIGFVASAAIGDSVFLAALERQYILKQEVKREKKHQSLFQIQRRHLLNRQRRHPWHAFETLEARCSHAQVPVFLSKARLCPVSLLSLWTLNCTRAHVGKE